MRCRTPTILFALMISAIFLLFSSSIHLTLLYSATTSGDLRPSISPHTSLLRSISGEPPLSPPSPISVLLPDWEILLLFPPPRRLPAAPFSCVFPAGATSSARPLLSGPAFLCSLPPSSRRRPLLSPQISTVHSPPSELLRWNRITYSSVSTPRDIILFAKGVKPRPFVRCAFISGVGNVFYTNVTDADQEVFRCRYPEKTELHSLARVSLHDGRRLIPSLAIVSPAAARRRRRRSICLCTMLYNSSKFLREWVVYHSAVGVDRFVLYDNGSEDGLEAEVGQLNRDGFDVRTRFWPWPKTQESGFSHCVVVDRDECEWIGFIDVDEYVFKPDWGGSNRPDRSMIRSVLNVDSNVGQVSIWCLDFGPSGLRVHPGGGVTQGYICRLKSAERHKSFVRPEAVAGSLSNSVHHFVLGERWMTWRLGYRQVAVNHYKYQAWAEFKTKFRRRVSANVVDWRVAVNPGSKDRTPGLGFEPVEPKDWTGRFCEVNDTRLRNVTRRWFRKMGPTNEYRMAWE